MCVECNIIRNPNCSKVEYAAMIGGSLYKLPKAKTALEAFGMAIQKSKMIGPIDVPQEEITKIYLNGHEIWDSIKGFVYG